MFNRSAAREHEMPVVGRRICRSKLRRWSRAGTHRVGQLRLDLLNQEFLLLAQRQFPWIGQRQVTWSWQRPSQPIQRLLSTPAWLTTTSIYLNVDDDRRHQETEEKHRVDW